MKLRDDIKQFLSTIPSDVTLVAASKYVDAIEMEKMLNVGINNFGENRVDAFLNKYDLLKDEKEIVWHFIGHLQTNKAKKIINKIDFLHSLDSLKLAELIQKERSSPLNVFVEINVSDEMNKNGIKNCDAIEFINNLKHYKNINIVGLMMMSIKGSTSKSYIEQFKKLKDLKDEINNKCNMNLAYLSMGMSDDYIYALKEGATHIRLGRILFKE